MRDFGNFYHLIHITSLYFHEEEEERQEVKKVLGIRNCKEKEILSKFVDGDVSWCLHESNNSQVTRSFLFCFWWCLHLFPAI